MTASDYFSVTRVCHDYQLVSNFANNISTKSGSSWSMVFEWKKTLVPLDLNTVINDQLRDALQQLERADLKYQGIMEDDKVAALMEIKEVKPTVKGTEDTLQR